MNMRLNTMLHVDNHWYIILVNSVSDILKEDIVYEIFLRELREHIWEIWRSMRWTFQEHPEGVLTGSTKQQKAAY